MKSGEFEQVISRVRTQKSEATAKEYVPRIREFREWLPEGVAFEEVDVIHIEDWLATLDETYANASSVGKGESGLSAAFNELTKLIQAGRINEPDDFEDWRRFGTPAERAEYTPDDSSTLKQRASKEDLKYLKPEEVDRMARATDRLRNELIIRLLFQTGVRVSEFCNIRLDDIDRDERRISVRGKGAKNRDVYYQPSLDVLMAEWIDVRRPAVYHADDSDALFPTSHGPAIIRQTVEEIVIDVAEKAGLQTVYGTSANGSDLHSITPHVLRHSFAMACLDKGWDIYTLSTALGHADVETTTSTYLHSDKERERRHWKNKGPSSDD